MESLRIAAGPGFYGDSWFVLNAGGLNPLAARKALLAVLEKR
jgi:hypothetical protein